MGIEEGDTELADNSKFIIQTIAQFLICSYTVPLPYPLLRAPL